MKLKLIKISFLIPLFIGISACTDLEAPLYTKLAPSTVLQTEEGVESALAGVYGGLFYGESGGLSFEGWAPQVVSADEIAIPVREGTHWDDGGAPRYTHLHDFRSSFVDWRIGQAYGVYMKVLGLANGFLSGTEGSKIATKQHRAEARFVRAFTYWQLLDLYGGVPIVTKPLQSGELPERKTSKEVSEFIKKEIAEIIPDLAGISATRINTGRATKEAAQMLHAKILLNSMAYEGTAPDWEELERICTDLIDNKAIVLESNYFDNFDDDNSNSKEIIWSIVAEGPNTKELVRAVIYPQLHYSGKDKRAYEQVDFWNGPAALATFVDRFDTSNVDSPPNSPVTNEPFLYNAPFPENFKDQRVAMFVRGQQYTPIGGDVPYEYDGLNIYYTKEMLPRVGVADADKEFDGMGSDALTGYRLLKFVPRRGLEEASPYNDYPIFRLADVYLMRAEARLASGNTAGAADDVNTIRRRAAGGRDIEFEAANGKSYSTKAATVDLDDIMDERSRELCIEGHRRTDLIRWNRFEGVTDPKLSGYSKFRAKRSSPPNPDHVKLYPIPDAHISANPNLKQNPGY